MAPSARARGVDAVKHKVRRDAFSVLARAVSTFLEKQGWVVLVVGDPRIQHDPGANEHNHKFVVKITAVNRRAKDAVESK